MNRKNVKQGVLTLFNRKYLKKLKRNRFNGSLNVLWKGGEIQHCRLVAKIDFFKGNKEEADLFTDEI